ncbi:MAG: hypothetical protein MJZ17_05335 [Bacteroidales bacterium]|nr:hypothetical protein [Bacteroidales bacterium]
MQDLAIRFNGDGDTVFDFDRMVEGKAAEEQRFLINVATSRNTVDLYEDKGTEMMEMALSGAVSDYNTAAHAGNFAALDTLLFIGAVSDDERMNSDDYVAEASISPMEYSLGALHYTVQLTFNDGTSTSEDVTIAI